MNENKKCIGFIGLGIMGKPMAKNLIRAGYSLNVYNRTKSKAQELVEMGAVLKETPAEVAENSDVVITIWTSWDFPSKTLSPLSAHDLIGGVELSFK